MPGTCTLDLASLPEGQRYEDRYQGYLEIFKRIAIMPADVDVTVINAPWSWAPLLVFLNCTVRDSRHVFDHCHVVERIYKGMIRTDRTMVEVLCGFRPECVDALWKIDVQWFVATGRTMAYPAGEEFIVTNNGSFHRHEVLDYMDALHAYEPKQVNVLLVPCAADKPYPAPLHQACLDRLPDDFYLMNATGVVGLVPQELWPTMPKYDSGIPNQWRLYETIKWYFDANPHMRIVVYCDFYSETIQAAFKAIGQDHKVSYVLPVKPYDDYLNLLDPARLAELEVVLRRQSSMAAVLD